MNFGCKGIRAGVIYIQRSGRGGLGAEVVGSFDFGHIWRGCGGGTRGGICHVEFS